MEGSRIGPALIGQRRVAVESEAIRIAPCILAQNGAVQVFGLTETPTAVWVRWPGGAEQRVDVPPNAHEITIAAK